MLQCKMKIVNKRNAYLKAKPKKQGDKILCDVTLWLVSALPLNHVDVVYF